MALSVEINGKLKMLPDLEPGATLHELVTALELKPDRIAIEQNGNIVSRDARGSVVVGNGDRIEIVHFVGGGTEVGIKEELTLAASQLYRISVIGRIW